MGTVKCSALAVCLTLCAVVSFSARVSSGNSKMCGAIVNADEGDDWIALRSKAFSLLRGACRRQVVRTTSILETVAPKDCSFVTEATSDRDFTFILKPLMTPFRLSFDVKAPSKAIILLARERTSESVFAEIALGRGNNVGAFVRTCYSGDPNCDKGDKPVAIIESGLVSSVEYHTFWVGLEEGVLTVGKGDKDEGLMVWNAAGVLDHEDVHVGIATYGDMESGDWVFHEFCE